MQINGWMDGIVHTPDYNDQKAIIAHAPCHVTYEEMNTYLESPTLHSLFTV